MDKPLISVIMGVYNDKKFLEDSIKSILNQTYDNLEFIICDDCSTDGSFDIVRKWAINDKRIVLLSNKVNVGLANTLNKCLDNSKGEFIARMDSDDISINTRLEHEISFLLKNPEVAVVGGSIDYINDQGEVYKSLICEGLVSLRQTVEKTCVVHPTVLMRRKAVLAVGGYTVNDLTLRAEDYDLWCKLINEGYQISNISNKVLLYRQDLNGMKKRRYKFRIQEAKLKKYWMTKTKQPILIYIYALKPLLVGLIPQKIMYLIKKNV